MTKTESVALLALASAARDWAHGRKTEAGENIPEHHLESGFQNAYRELQAVQAKAWQRKIKRFKAKNGIT